MLIDPSRQWLYYGFTAANLGHLVANNLPSSPGLAAAVMFMGLCAGLWRINTTITEDADHGR